MAFEIRWQNVYNGNVYTGKITKASKVCRQKSHRQVLHRQIRNGKITRARENTPFWITHQRVFPRLLTNPEILSGCKLAKLYQMSGTLKSFKKLNKHSQFQMLNCFAYATLQALLICYHPHVHKNPSRTRSLFTGFRRKMGFQASHLTEIGFTSAF